MRLRDGRLLVGTIVEHDLDGLAMVAALDGGRFQLVWSDLFPGEADRLRDQFGYRNEAQVPMTEAHRILLTNGRELVGRILRQDSRKLELRMKETTSIIPLQQMAAPPEPIVVEAASILTPQQFYSEQLPTVDAEDAKAQLEFAQELEVMFALEESHRHYGICEQLAAAVGDSAMVKRAQGAMSKLERTLANRAEAEYIEQIRQLMHRGRFTQAGERIDGYEDSFPEPALRGEFLQLADTFEPRRAVAGTRYLERHWYPRVLGVLKRKALDEDVRLDEAMAWLEGELPIQVRNQLITEMDDIFAELELEQVDELWAARFEQGANSHSANFGDGSWILGEERAKAGLRDAEEEDDGSGKSEAQREMEERMKRYMDNLEAQRRARSSGDEDVSPEDWWRRATVTQRFQWLMAYYAEFSGDYEVLHVRFSHCSTCTGQGFLETLEVSSQGSRTRREKCPTCHGVQVRRALSFR